jgi:biotin carboxyl carrier protein
MPTPDLLSDDVAAMKMEAVIRAERDCTVTEVLVTTGA